MTFSRSKGEELRLEFHPLGRASVFHFWSVFGCVEKSPKDAVHETILRYYNVVKTRTSVLFFILPRQSVNNIKSAGISRFILLLLSFLTCRHRLV